jgi:hypothetical protein
MRFEDLARQNNENMKGLRVGRRLYLFFSGHGCAFPPNEAALLAANFTTDANRYHIPGRLWAHIFSVRGYFDEVFLLMDCCRESLPLFALQPPPLTLTTADTDSIENGRTFYGFATRWNRRTKDSKFNGVAHGIFTYALLAGLSGKAAHPTTGCITAASLGQWLKENMKVYLTDDQKNNPDVPKSPDLDYEPEPAEQMILATVAPPKFRVRINIANDLVGQPVQILDGAFNIVCSLSAAPLQWQVDLYKGGYLVQGYLANRQKGFFVNGSGDVDVQI